MPVEGRLEETRFGRPADPRRVVVASTRGSRLLALRLSLALLCGLAFEGRSWAASAGPQPGMTGAPGTGTEAAEGTCVSCHTSFAINPDDKGTLTIEGVPDTYAPGQTYSLTFRLAHPDPAVLRWGFQMTAIALKDGSGAGEFVATDPATTQVLSAMSGTRTYIEHSYGGTAIGQPGGNAWTFDWKAPAADVGSVGFFAAANASNVDGSNQGDRVYSKSPAPLAETRGPAR